MPAAFFIDTNITISAFFWKGYPRTVYNQIKDRKCAIDGRANYIISGDSHLLELGEHDGIQILKANDFLIKEGLIAKNQTP